MIKLLRVARDECGCETFKQISRGVEVGGLIVQQCIEHTAEHMERHQRAMADYRARLIDKPAEKVAE